jgi:uncharacterized membrane protein
MSQSNPPSGRRSESPAEFEGLVPVELGDGAGGPVRVFVREEDLRSLHVRAVEGSEQLIMQASSSFYSGPTPHPDFLRQYGEIDPSYADRVLRTVELEQQHRMSLEIAESNRRDRNLDADLRYAGKGQYLAFALGVCALASATAVALLGGQNAASTVVASLVGVGGLGSLAYAFTRPPTPVRASSFRDNKQSVPPPGH